MKIGLVDLAYRVDGWQQKLEPLGLVHWSVTVFIDDEVPGAPNSAAGVSFGHSYDSAEMHFERDWLSKVDAKNLDKVIIHELLHMAFRSYDNAVELALEWMPKQTADLYEENMRQEREAIVERLARTIYQRAKR